MTWLGLGAEGWVASPQPPMDFVSKLLSFHTFETNTVTNECERRNLIHNDINCQYSIRLLDTCINNFSFVLQLCDKHQTQTWLPRVYLSQTHETLDIVCLVRELDFLVLKVSLSHWAINLTTSFDKRESLMVDSIWILKVKLISHFLLIFNPPVRPS